MIFKKLISISSLIVSLLYPAQNLGMNEQAVGSIETIRNDFNQRKILAVGYLDLNSRHPDQQINRVFAENILLAVSYFGQKNVPDSHLLDQFGNNDFKQAIFILQVSKLLNRNLVTLELGAGEVFAFHPMVLPEFQSEFQNDEIGKQKLVTGFSKYTAKEGYQTALGLPGNGVCHLASLMNWVASEAGLKVTAKVNHDFAPVPGISGRYGTSIRYTPDGSLNSANQNLYIKNIFDVTVKLIFFRTGGYLNLVVLI